MSSAPLPSDTGPITVRRARCPHLFLVSLAFLGAMALLHLTTPFFDGDWLPWYIEQPIAAILAIGFVRPLGQAIEPYFRKRLLPYNSANRTIRAWSFWRSGWWVYPCERFNHLEYSPERNRIYEVRTNGSRAKLPVRRRQAVEADWQAFIEQFQRDHPIASAEGSTSPESPDGSCRCRIRVLLRNADQ